MNSENAFADKLNKKIDAYLEAGEYEKAEEAIEISCRLQNLAMAETMPEDFLLQIKKKEKKITNMKKSQKHTMGIVAAAAAACILIGGTASAAVLRNTDIHIFDYGLTNGELAAETETSFLYEKIDLPEGTEEIAGPVKEESGGTSHAWTTKKTWEESHTQYSSDNAVDWTPVTVTDQITEYQYEDYATAAKDTGFENVFKKAYSGSVSYYEIKHQDMDAGTDCSISGDLSYGNGTFTFSQSKEEDSENTVYSVLTGETSNEREYISKGGIRFPLSDDTSTGKIRTTTAVMGKHHQVVLTFTDLSEEEIHQILDSVEFTMNE